MKIKQFFRKNGVPLTIGLVGVFVGAIVSSVVAVRAAIPDTTGTIHSCRNNTTTMLRVIDNANQSCDGNESGVNWDQMGIKAYTRVKINPTGSMVIDLPNSKNITAWSYTDVAVAGGLDRYTCITSSVTPNGIIVEDDAYDKGFKDSTGTWLTENTYTQASDFAARCSNSNIALKRFIPTASIGSFAISGSVVVY